MAKPRAAQPVKLFAGLLSGDPDLLRRACQLLGKQFGNVDLESTVWPFDQTDYYEAEMGPDLHRCFVGFAGLVDPGGLAEIKLETNALEDRLAEDCVALDIARPVNIDPGYVGLGKLVLATTKDRAHRLYLGSGIYGEVTLRYTQGGWQTQPWTYPDYHRPEYHEFFVRLRNRLREEQKSAGGAAATTPPEDS